MQKSSVISQNKYITPHPKKKKKKKYIYIYMALYADNMQMVESSERKRLLLD
jgi:hypothetical protein